MKNRKLVIAVFLCFALLVTGIGYATLSGHLTVRGTASFTKSAATTGFIEKILFSDAKVVQSGSAASATLKDEASATGQIAVFNVRTLAVQGETAIFTYTLTNTNLVDAKITIKPQHDATGEGDPESNPTDQFSNFDVDSITIEKIVSGNAETGYVLSGHPTTILVDGQTPNADTVLYTLEAKEAAVVTVTVSLNRTPAADIVVPETYFLHLTATSADETPTP